MNLKGPNNGKSIRYPKSRRKSERRFSETMSLAQPRNLPRVAEAEHHAGHPGQPAHAAYQGIVSAFS